MQSVKDFELPPDIEALIPDAVEHEKTPAKAETAIKEIEEDSLNPQRMLEVANSIPSAKIAINGIFKHPPDFTEEEWDIIIKGLKSHLPLYAIAMRVHCERHFLSRKIQEMKEVAQVAIDAREGMVDVAETQLMKLAQQGSIAASIYILDHLGKDRGWGDQSERKETGEDVQIVFGEIPESQLEAADKQIEEAQKKTTPTLAKELADVEVPKAPSTQDLAFAEDMMKKIEAASTPKPVEVTPSSVSKPAYENNRMSEDRYDFLENAFDNGGESPFDSF